MLMVRMLVGVVGSVALSLVALPALAQQTWEYQFGRWLGAGPTYQPTEPFAYMSVSTADSFSFGFVLRAHDPIGDGTLAAAFGPGAYISKAVFNTVSGDAPVGISNVQTNGSVGAVSLGAADIHVGGIGFDFFDCFNTGGGLCGYNGGNAGQLQSGEWLSWTLNFAAPQTPLLGVPPVAIRVQGFQQDGVGSGWYTPVSAVPEPEMLAMMLAGLGLMGFVARRRRQNMAA